MEEIIVDPEDIVEINTEQKDEEQEKIEVKLKIFPDPILRQQSATIFHGTPGLQNLFDAMVSIMKSNEGIGIAAPQVGIPIRMIVITNKDEHFPLINPKIIEKSKETEIGLEGCLSIPGIIVKIKRPTKIKVAGQNIKGERIEVNAEGDAARELCHEIDHLDGILFIDRASPAAKNSIKKQLKKFGVKTYGHK